MTGHGTALSNMCLQPLEYTALSWGIIGKSAPILAEITRRKSQITSDNNLLDGNEIYNNTGNGGQIYNGSNGVTAHDNTVRNNTIHNKGSSRDANAGIVLSSGSGNIAYNNIIWNSKVGIQLDYDAANSQVYNNTVYGNTIGGIYNGAGSANAVIRNNIVFNNASTIQDDSGSATIDHNYTSDPLFVNAASDDFHLQIGK